jgi:hypothetical protein
MKWREESLCKVHFAMIPASEQAGKHFSHIKCHSGLESMVEDMDRRVNKILTIETDRDIFTEDVLCQGHYRFMIHFNSLLAITRTNCMERPANSDRH